MLSLHWQPHNELECPEEVWVVKCEDTYLVKPETKQLYGFKNISHAFDCIEAAQINTSKDFSLIKVTLDELMSISKSNHWDVIIPREDAAPIIITSGGL